MPKPLEGVKIVDLTSVVMGPYATQALGDMGADIIKVEAPSGDTTRMALPMRSKKMGWSYLGLNRSKRSIVLDLKQEDGLAALLEIVRGADVFISNIRPKAMARLGLGYEQLSAINPRLIVVSMVGFDENGPYAGNPVYEDLIQGLTAVPSILVDAGSSKPHFVPISFNDRAVGLHGAVSLLAALYWREQSGEGQHIQVPMFETMVPFSLGGHMGGMAFDPPLGPPGYKRTLTDQRGPYKTADGHICIIVYTDKQWREFLRLIGKGDWYESDPRFRDFGSRTEHSAELYPLIYGAMAERTTAEWLDILQDADIPATPLHTLESIFGDKHLEAIDYFKIEEHPSEGRLVTMSVAEKWSKTQPEVTSPPPLLGQQSVEILREAGLEQATIDRMIASGTTIDGALRP